MSFPFFVRLEKGVMKKNLLFAAACFILFIILYTLSVKQFVPIPNDDNHEGIIQKEACLECHGKDGQSPLNKDHPPKDQCFKCHEREAE
jgi:hypothetical protein